MGNTPPPVTFTTPSSGGSSGPYGLSADAAGSKFDLAGLPQLGSGSVTGSDLLNQFVAAGSGRGDPAVVAAIQQALLLGGFYSSDKFVPQNGVVKEEDSTALATALNQLAIANKAAPSGGGFPTLGVAQFLTQRAAQGAASGQGATKTAVYRVTSPDPAQVAATFEEVAQKLEGKRPSSDDVQGFVTDYIKRYTDTQHQNVDSYIAAKYGTGDPTTAPLSPSAPQQLPHGLVGESGTYVHGSSAQPLDMTTSMMSLQDVINETANPGGGGANPLHATAVDQQAEPDMASSAEDYVRKNNPGAVAKNDLGNTLNSFLNLITTKLV